MARLEYSSQNLLEIKYRAMTKLDVLGRGWGVCRGVETLDGAVCRRVFLRVSPRPRTQKTPERS